MKLLLTRTKLTINSNEQIFLSLFYVHKSGKREQNDQEYIVNNGFQTMSWNVSLPFPSITYSPTVNNIHDCELLQVPFLLNKVAELYETQVD